MILYLFNIWSHEVEDIDRDIMEVFLMFLQMGFQGEIISKIT